MPTTDIIIVNWNSRHHLRDCLDSIVAADKSNYQLNKVIVVDNASIDDSLNNIEGLDLPLVLVRNTQNLGFAKGVNQGLEESEADYVLLLNPDVRLFKDSLSKPIAFLQQPAHQNIGILGVQLIDDQNQITRACAYFPNAFIFFTHTIGLNHLFPKGKLTLFMSEWDHRENREVDHVMGAFYLMRRQVFECIGKMDEQFFLYYEDLDFSLRAQKAGWHTFYLADVQAYHRNGGTSEQIKAKRLAYSMRSRIKYAYKHFSWIGATGFALGILFLAPIMRICYALLKARPIQIIETLKAYTMLWQFLLWQKF